MVYEGLPEIMRGDIWCMLCEIESSTKLHNEKLYEKLLSMPNEEMEYRIKKDINRTLPELNLF